MNEANLLWSLLGVASVVLNVVFLWVRIANRNQARKVETPDPMNMRQVGPAVKWEHIEHIHSWIEKHDEEHNRLDTMQREDKQAIIDEIIKMRNTTHEHLRSVERAIGRLEGAQVK